MNTVYDSYQNEEDGIEALIFEIAGKYKYKVVFRDTDAQQTISAKFFPEHQLHAAVAAAKEFVA